jgi:ATP-binding cassette subfamily C protein CydCD
MDVLGIPQADRCEPAARRAGAGEPVKPLDRRLLRYAKRARLPIAAVAGCGAGVAGLVIVQAQLLAAGIAGAFLHGATVTMLRGTLIALAVVVALRALLAWAGEAAAYHASTAVKAGLRAQLLSRVAELGPRWLATEGGRGGGRGTAELTALATDGVEALDGYFARYLPQLVLGVVVPIAVVVRVGLADPLAGLTILGTLPLIPLFGALAGRAAAGYAKQRWRALAVLSHHFLDMVTGLPTLKVFGQAKSQRVAIGKVTDDYRRATMGTLRVAFLSSLVLELIATLSVAMVAVGVGLSLVYGHLDLRTGLLALILAPEAYLPLRQAAAQFHATTDGLAAAEEALAIIETPASRSPGHSGCDNPAGSPTILVQELSVTHPGRPEAAPDAVTLTMRPGEITVLTGPSGCGKSTLIDVLLGFAAPTTGRVQAVDRVSIGWVPQEPYMFPGTVASNIRLGWPDAPEGAVAAAARAAALDDVPLDRPVTERGGGLSAGQRRRVALARALLPGRPVLLLDEPTAGLDAATEDRVLQTLRREAAAGRVILVAAHHPRVVAIADQVVHMTTARAGVPA